MVVRTVCRAVRQPIACGRQCVIAILAAEVSGMGESGAAWKIWAAKTAIAQLGRCVGPPGLTPKLETTRSCRVPHIPELRKEVGVEVVATNRVVG